MFAKKLTDKSIMFACIMLGILILVLVYFVPYLNTKAEIDDLKAQNASLQTTIASLQEYYDNRHFYITETETLQKEISVIATSYPSMYRPEDYILEAIDVQNASEYIEYQVIEMQNPTSIAVIDAATVKGANIDGLEDTIEFNQQNVVYNNKIDYPSLKQALAEVFRAKHCLNIQRITYTTDAASGELEGNIILGYYYVTGTGVEYVEPQIPSYIAGTDNIFGHYIIEDEEENVITE